MRREAQKRCVGPSGPDQLEWISAEADATGIEAQSVDIVTASQSFHWMNPDTTLPEVARILRPGGVFAAIDCDWPPSILPELELAYNECVAKVDDPKYAQVRLARVQSWPKHQHLESIRLSGRFRVSGADREIQPIAFGLGSSADRVTVRGSSKLLPSGIRV